MKKDASYLGCPTYIKIGYYYFYYTYMKPIYLAVIAYMHQKKKTISSPYLKKNK